jgi:hypothetical protein
LSLKAERAVQPNIQPRFEIKQPDKPQTDRDADLIDLTKDGEDNDEPLQAPNDQDATVNERAALGISEIPELVQKAISADDIILKPAKKDEGGAGSRLYKYNTRIFKKALIFFDTNLDENDKCPVIGIKQPLHTWQLYTAYEMFMNPITTGVNGLLIGLDVGFGKTRMAMLYILARAVLATRWVEVKAEWNADKPKLHLLKSNSDRKACCSSQQGFMVQWPCVWESETREVCDKYLSNSPAVIIGPNGVERHLEKCVESLYLFWY